MALQVRRLADTHILVEGAGVTDHGDAAESGSIAWADAELGGADGVIELLPGTYNFVTSIATAATTEVIARRGVDIHDGAGNPNFTVGGTIRGGDFTIFTWTGAGTVTISGSALANPSTWIVTPSRIEEGTKIWFYQNVAPAGWTLDATPSDELLAVKGGTQAYNAAGGTVAGTWTVAGLTKDAHTHAFTQPTAHGITQPTFVANIFINGVKTQIEYKQIAATLWTATNEADVPSTDVSTETSSYGADTERIIDVALSNNHSGGSVNAQSDAGISSTGNWRAKARLGIICTKD